MVWLKWVIGGFIFLVLLGLVLYFSKIKVKLKGKLEGVNGQLEIQIFIWRLRIFRLQVPKVKLEEDPLQLILQQENNLKGEEQEKLEKGELQKLFKRMKAIWGILQEKRPDKKLFYLHEFYWESSIGCGQADQTAILTGFVWAMKTSSMAVVQVFFEMDRPFINVIPSFNQWCLESNLSCMISFRLGKAIRQAIWIRKQLKRRRLLHGGTSYSRTHEDSA